MNLEERITLLVRLKKYLEEDAEDFREIKKRAFEKNKWFVEEFIDLSVANICNFYLDHSLLRKWVMHYHIDDNVRPQKVGIVMAGNIPLVGFHDFLSAFVLGHRQVIRFSEKDDVLLKHVVEKMNQWNPQVAGLVGISPMLKDCDAYIATGSNNSSRYFQYYFGKYPSLIRTNKTSVAVLSGNETFGQLTALADDVYSYFGLGCRNVTKIYVPEGYDFVMLLNAFKKYNYFADITKYKNNYDYNLALLIMNNKFYMTNESIILVENETMFSPVSELHYSFYTNKNEVLQALRNHPDVQCVAGGEDIPFGKTQQPGLFDYADGVDTVQFLLGL